MRAMFTSYLTDNVYTVNRVEKVYEFERKWICEKCMMICPIVFWGFDRSHSLQMLLLIIPCVCMSSCIFL